MVCDSGSILFLYMKGEGLVNKLINNLPFEFHLPGYNYCGPGTRLHERLVRGDKGINKLDEYCKYHDIAYNKYQSLKDRHKADITLLKMAKKRALSSDASTGEKLAANLVNNLMLTKLSTGAGLKKNFKSIVSHTKKCIRKIKPKCRKKLIELAYAAARELNQDSPSKLPRIIAMPKSGGVLPLIPIFAGLSAAGSIASGISGIVKTIKEYKAAKKRLKEMEQHNQNVGGVCIGNGLRLNRYKDGLGLYLKTGKN